MPAHPAHHAGAPHPRLRPPLHYQPVRRLRPGQRLGDRPALPQAPPPEFLRFLKLIDGTAPRDLDLHLILDNYATHKTPRSRTGFKNPRFHLHFTPTSSSWLDLVER